MPEPVLRDDVRSSGRLESKPKKLLIDGKPVDALSGKTFNTTNPANGEVAATFAAGEAEDIDRAVAAARRAFEGPWSMFKPSERQAVLLRLADLIEREWEALAIMDTLEMGRPITSSRALRDISVRTLRHHAGYATAIHGQTMDNSFPVPLLSYTVREPLGVVGAIIPWNGPVFSAIWKIAPVLATGCTMVMKPAEQSSLSPLRIAELCLEAGIPPGVVNVVTGFGSTAGAALTEHMDVDKISFTGSCQTGQRIIQASARNVKRVTMELGGKSPDIVFADADLNAAVAGAAMGVFSNSGQVCSAGSRLFIERPIFEAFSRRVADYGAALRIGDPLDPETQIGPLVSQVQLDRVCGYLSLGVKEGARAISGGKRLTEGTLAKGFYVPPTVFVDVKDSMRVAKEEIFGPVICALPFDTLDEVVTRANSTQFGLGSGVWTRDIGKAHSVASRLKAGSVWVNYYQAMDPAVPFGGYKMSGYGREGGLEHIEGYLNIKGIWIAKG